MKAVPEITDLDIAFGNPNHLPAWEEIPDEFKHGRTKWNRLFNDLFYRGAAGTITEKDGIDPMKAGRVIQAIMASWMPKHEHKEAGCAYLMSLWFEDWSPDVQGPEKPVQSMSVQ